MTKRKIEEHHGTPTEESFAINRDDSSQLLQCAECGAWVRFAKDGSGLPVLEAHVDRRPKVTRYRILVPARGR